SVPSAGGTAPGATGDARLPARPKRRDNGSVPKCVGVRFRNRSRRWSMKRLLAVLAFALAVPIGVLRAEGESSRPLFESEDTLHVRISAPLTSLVRDRSDTEYLEG